MNLEDICVGDILKVREWSDMVAEYGENSFGDIYISSDTEYFLKNMSYLCGRVFTVKSINGRDIFSVEKIEITPIERWAITAGMLEPPPAALKPLDADDFNFVDITEYL